MKTLIALLIAYACLAWAHDYAKRKVLTYKEFFATLLYLVKRRKIAKDWRALEYWDFVRLYARLSANTKHEMFAYWRVRNLFAILDSIAVEKGVIDKND